MATATKTLKTLRTSDFVTILMAHEINGHLSAEFSKIVTVTEPKLNKKHRETKVPCPFEKVTKESESFCMLKVIYQNSMNKELTEQGYQEPGENLFVAGPLPWGEWVTYADGKRSKLLIRHKDQIYIRATFNLDIRPITVYADENGLPVQKADLEGYLPPEKDELVSVRTFKASSIRTMHLSGTIYTVLPDEDLGR